MDRHAYLDFAYACIGALPALDIPDGKRLYGVDQLTGWVLEQRVALEACA